MGQSPPSEQPELRVILNVYTIHEALMTLLSGYLVVVNAFGALEPVGTQIGLADFVDISPLNFSVPQNFTRKTVVRHMELERRGTFWYFRSFAYLFV